MKIDIQIDSTLDEPMVVIRAPSLTPEVQQMTELLAETGSLSLLVGFRDGTACVLHPDDIFRIYAVQGKVYASTRSGEYTLRLRLYEAEKRLAPHRFVRISKSEMVNLHKVVKFDLNMSGTILVVLQDGTDTFVSRRYVPLVRSVLGL